MISTLVSDISILGVDLLVTYFTGVGDIEMLAMSRLNVILHGMKLRALLSTQEASIPGTSVQTDKLLQLVIPG